MKGAPRAAIPASQRPAVRVGGLVLNTYVIAMLFNSPASGEKAKKEVSSDPVQNIKSMAMILADQSTIVSPTGRRYVLLSSRRSILPVVRDRFWFCGEGARSAPCALGMQGVLLRPPNGTTGVSVSLGSSRDLMPIIRRAVACSCVELGPRRAWVVGVMIVS
jgi:hypothetical protein